MWHLFVVILSALIVCKYILKLQRSVPRPMSCGIFVVILSALIVCKYILKLQRSVPRPMSCGTCLSSYCQRLLYVSIYLNYKDQFQGLCHVAPVCRHTVSAFCM